MTEYSLAEVVAGLGAKFGIPGVSVGVWAGGREEFASHGVTSLDDPQPVGSDTLYVLGSVSKSFTASAMMRLVADGRVELDAPVRRYVPELVLPDEKAADEITVAQLLNHTAGLDWRMRVDTGEDDGALAAYVAAMAESELIAPPGTRASYSQMGFNLAGRVIENVTGLTFEQAVSTLLLEPLGLTRSSYASGDALTLPHAVGHNLAEDGTLPAVRQWKDSRANNPGGGLAASMGDLLTWARFHLGHAPAGAPVLPAQALTQMREATVELPGNSLGDAFGICWFLKDIDGVATAGHGGSANGQFADLLLVPSRDFAVVVASNAGPDAGLAFNQTIVKWALEHYLDIAEKDPEPQPYDPDAAAQVAGAYANELMTLTITDDGAALAIDCAVKPEIRAAADTELPADMPAAPLGLLPGDAYIVTEGGLQGQRGIFTRDTTTGVVVAMDLAGRVFTRVPADPA